VLKLDKKLSEQHPKRSKKILKKKYLIRLYLIIMKIINQQDIKEKKHYIKYLRLLQVLMVLTLLSLMIGISIGFHNIKVILNIIKNNLNMVNGLVGMTADLIGKKMMKANL
jgi:hypothetical protein